MLNDARSAHAPDWLDRLGVILSGACLVHCVALPFVLMFLPFMSMGPDAPFHQAIFVAVVGVAGWTLSRGFRRHHDRQVLLLAVSGALLMGLGAAPVALADIVEHALSVGGGLLLAGAQLKNMRLIHAKASCNCRGHA